MRLTWIKRKGFDGIGTEGISMEMRKADGERLTGDVGEEEDCAGQEDGRWRDGVVVARS